MSNPASIEDILEQLDGVKGSGNGNWTANCPVPGHETPGGHLSIRDRGGKALVKCHGSNHSYAQICFVLGFDSLTYYPTGTHSASMPTTKLNDAEAISLLKEIYGLTDTTIEHFGIEPDYQKQAWKYPVEDGIRFKKYSRKSPNKYWHTEGITNQLYGLVDIPAGTSEVWLVNGEPAVWVLWQTGIPGTCGIYGEGQLPDNTPHFLKEWGIKTVDIPFDRDAPGEKAAIKDYHNLKAALQVRIRQLPIEFEEHSDVCDLFDRCGRDNHAFREALENLPEVESVVLEYEVGKDKSYKRDAVSLVCLADVEPETVAWLWYPYIPKRKLTLLEGDPGVGKSWVGLALATGVSLGKGLPGMKDGEPATVVIASAEDGLGDTIRPRLDTMGADTRMIHAIKGALDFNNGGLDILREVIELVRPALVVVDPLVAYIGARVDLHRANEVRAIMTRLADIAETYGVAILAIRHLTKGGALKPIYRGMGSIDLTASCRSVIMAGCDPENPQKRGLVHIKSNLAPMGDAIGFEVRDDCFYWTGDSDLTAERILVVGNTSQGKSAIDEAVDFLKAELAEGSVEWQQIERDRKTADITVATLRRARKILGVKIRRQGEAGRRGGGRSLWELPGVLSVQNDLLVQDAHIEKNEQINPPSFENAPLPKTGEQVNTPEAILSMPFEKAIEIWRSEGAPLIHLGPGENCLDLQKFLSHPNVSELHLQAVKTWLEKALL